VLPRLLLGTLSILLTQVLVAAAIAGVGLAARRAFGLRAVSLDDCFLSFWVGLACVTLLLLGWNFFLPITGWTALAALGAGAIGLWSARPALAGLFAADDWRPSPRFLVLLALTALWIANLSLGALDNYDSALYHIQVVRWAEQFAAVPGIGNLHAPLAFNNSSLLFDAMLSAGPWNGRSNHLANGLLILVLLSQAMVAGARLFAGSRQPRRMFEFLLLAPAANLAQYGGATSFVTDVPTSLVVLVAAAACYAWMSDGDEAGPADFRLVAIAGLLALAVTFKTNAAIFAAVCFPLLIVLWLAGSRPAPARRARTLRWAGGAVVALAVAWTGRGIVLSGYPLFPATLAGAPVEWRVPAEHAEAEFAYIVHSGRGSTRNLPVIAGTAGVEAWFDKWAGHALEDPYRIALPLALTLLAVVAWLVLRRRAQDDQPAPNLRAWLLVLPIVPAVTSWFLIAPEPRYVVPYLWALAALACSQVFGLWIGRARRSTPGAVLLAATALGLSPVLLSPLISTRRLHRDEASPLRVILQDNFNRPGSDRLLVQPLEGQAELSSYQTRSGLRLNVAKERCWDAPLPCTPNPAPNLRLRDPANLAKGFRVDGPWQMEYWPLRWQPHFLAAWRKSRNRAKAALH